MSSVNFCGSSSVSIFATNSFSRPLLPASACMAHSPAVEARMSFAPPAFVRPSHAFAGHVRAAQPEAPRGFGEDWYRLRLRRLSRVYGYDHRGDEMAQHSLP